MQYDGGIGLSIGWIAILSVAIALKWIAIVLPRGKNTNNICEVCGILRKNYLQTGRAVAWIAMEWLAAVERLVISAFRSWYFTVTSGTTAVTIKSTCSCQEIVLWVWVRVCRDMSSCLCADAVLREALCIGKASTLWRIDASADQIFRTGRNYFPRFAYAL